MNRIILIAVIGLSSVFASCEKKVENVPYCDGGICGTELTSNATLIDKSGLDGCGWVIEMGWAKLRNV